ncbi:MAG: hypothetical protein ACI4QR_02760 [Eubacteriales bacterium]
MVKKYIEMVDELRFRDSVPVENILICPCGYKESNTPPEEGFIPFEPGAFWGDGKDTHAWFSFSLDVPEDLSPAVLSVSTERTGWNVFNPQFIAYVNGKMQQGLDTNHTKLFFGSRTC